MNHQRKKRKNKKEKERENNKESSTTFTDDERNEEKNLLPPFPNNHYPFAIGQLHQTTRTRSVVKVRCPKKGQGRPKLDPKKSPATAKTFMARADVAQGVNGL